MGVFFFFEPPAFAGARGNKGPELGVCWLGVCPHAREHGYGGLPGNLNTCMYMHEQSL